MSNSNTTPASCAVDVDMPNTSSRDKISSYKVSKQNKRQLTDMGELSDIN